MCTDQISFRLGLGASVTEYHAREAENRKLRNQLLSHSKKHAARDEQQGTSNSVQSALKRKANSDEEESDDQEDSRAGSFHKKKARSAVPVQHQSTPQRSTATSTSTLFNPPTPSAPSPSPSPVKKAPQAVAGASFYGNATATTSNMSLLSKNQRKKERDRLKRQELQRLKEEESRREAEDEARALLGSDDVVEDSTSVLDKLKRPDLNGEDQDASDEYREVNMEMSSPVRGDSQGSPGEGRKKKKRRRSKQKENGDPPVQQPLLNL